MTRGTIYRQLLDTARILEESIPDVAVEADKIMNWLRTIRSILSAVRT